MLVQTLFVLWSAAASGYYLFLIWFGFVSFRANQTTFECTCLLVDALRAVERRRVRLCPPCDLLWFAFCFAQTKLNLNARASV